MTSVLLGLVKDSNGTWSVAKKPSDNITEAMPKALPEAGNPGNRKRWAACEPAN